MIYKNLLFIGIIFSINLTLAMEGPGEKRPLKSVQLPYHSMKTEDYAWLSPVGYIEEDLRESLIKAVKEGNVTRARELIQAGIDPYEVWGKYSAAELVGEASDQLDNPIAIAAIPQMRELFGLNEDFNPAEETTH